MNIKINVTVIFIFILLSASLVSCGEDTADDENVPLLAREDGWISLSMSLSLPSDKTVVKKLSAYPGKDKEGQINTLRLVFYYQDKVYKYFDLNISVKGNTLSGGDVLNPGIITPDLNGTAVLALKPIALRKRNYKIVALVNLPQSVRDITTEDKPLSLLTEGILELNSVYDLITNDGNESSDKNNFYMANTSGPVICTADDFYDKYQDAVEDTNGKRPELAVERAVAEVLFTTNMQDKQDITDNGVTYNLDFSKIEWTVDVVNRKIYWLRHMTYKRGGEDNGLPDNNLEQPEDYFSKNGEERKNLYAEDPNFDKISGGSNVSDNFTYIKEGRAKWRLYNEAGENFIYVPENTMRKDEFKMNVSTQLVLRIPYAIPPSLTYDKYMYFRIPIRHFMKTEVQTVGGEDDSEGGPGGSEEGEGGFVGSGEYWGAYGIVRNNIYRINLNSISKIGDLELKDPENTVNRY